MRYARCRINESFQMVGVDFGVLIAVIIHEVCTFLIYLSDAIWSKPGTLQFSPFPLLRSNVFPQDPLAHSKSRLERNFLPFFLFFTTLFRTMASNVSFNAMPEDTALFATTSSTELSTFPIEK